jgi:hypothetical protein
MRHLTTVFLVLSVFLFSCEQDEEITLQGTGSVVDYAGAGNCGIIIELDDGNNIQPLYFPDGFVFSQGQRVLVEYVELPNVHSSCDKGMACDVKYAEELSCAPYVDLYFSNYDSLARDPVFIHDAYVDDECLYLKLSYSGGCEEHTIDLARMHPWTASSSTVPTFEIRHNANGDMCEAYFTQELRFNLAPIILEGKTEFVLTAKLTNGEIYNKIFEL